MKRSFKARTPDEVRADFIRRGKTLSEWARAHGYSPNLVYVVLDGRTCKAGKSHEIAVLLGLKDGVIESKEAA